MNNLLLFIFIHINSRDELIKQIGILFHAIHLLEVVQAFVKDSSVVGREKLLTQIFLHLPLIINLTLTTPLVRDLQMFPPR
jgi:hypothetical protein|uniref:Uncharacterized protein n=1 Tax=Populus trichocarpa TaxID=3694 RepID=A0A2K1WNH1_POPTR